MKGPPGRVSERCLEFVHRDDVVVDGYTAEQDVRSDLFFHHRGECYPGEGRAASDLTLTTGASAVDSYSVVAMQGQDRRKILVVDDELDSRQILERLLEHAGFDVVALSDAQSAVSEARTRPFDAIILDLKLPGKSGAEAAWEIRKRNPSVPLVAYSGYLDIWDKDDLADLGFNDVIPKPADGKVIVEKLSRLIQA